MLLLQCSQQLFASLLFPQPAVSPTGVIFTSVFYRACTAANTCKYWAIQTPSVLSIYILNRPPDPHPPHPPTNLPSILTKLHSLKDHHLLLHRDRTQHKGSWEWFFGFTPQINDKKAMMGVRAETGNPRKTVRTHWVQILLEFNPKLGSRNLEMSTVLIILLEEVEVIKNNAKIIHGNIWFNSAI